MYKIKLVRPSTIRKHIKLTYNKKVSAEFINMLNDKVVEIISRCAEVMPDKSKVMSMVAAYKAGLLAGSNTNKKKGE